MCVGVCVGVGVGVGVCVGVCVGVGVGVGVCVGVGVMLQVRKQRHMIFSTNAALNQQYTKSHVAMCWKDRNIFSHSIFRLWQAATVDVWETLTNTIMLSNAVCLVSVLLFGLYVDLHAEGPQTAPWPAKHSRVCVESSAGHTAEPRWRFKPLMYLLVLSYHEWRNDSDLPNIMIENVIITASDDDLTDVSAAVENP